MPNDTFTLSLFDNTALSSWPCPTSSTAADLYDENEEADAGSDTPPPSSAPVARGSNFPSPATGSLPAAGPRGRATTSPRSSCRRRLRSRAARQRLTSRRGCCASPVSARPSWRRAASAAPARQNSGPAGRRPARRSRQPSRRRNTLPCSAPRSTLITRRRRSSVDSGAPPSGWVFAAAACWSPAWAPACSSPCCPPHCAARSV